MKPISMMKLYQLILQKNLLHRVLRFQKLLPL
ncbi:unnamed protein product [Schistosoma mattheei]|uniref:Uncharacterized protein n=1 Tax=Schistosoma mattheei TaxID=31246 RepID=A0A3P8GBE2_9TREM|nr:unnamed protein product [Schistosoma mattheei]